MPLSPKLQPGTCRVAVLPILNGAYSGEALPGIHALAWDCHCSSSFLFFLVLSHTSPYVAQTTAYLPSPGSFNLALQLFHPSAWGFNATADTPWPNPPPGEADRRPVVPLINRTLDQWWMHGYQDLPPHKNDIMQLPAGGARVVELACDKRWTSYWRMTDATLDETTNFPCRRCYLRYHRIHTYEYYCSLRRYFAVSYHRDQRSRWLRSLYCLSIKCIARQA